MCDTAVTGRTKCGLVKLRKCGWITVQAVVSSNAGIGGMQDVRGALLLARIINRQDVVFGE